MITNGLSRLPLHVAVLEVLHQHSNAHGICRESMSDLCRATGYSSRSVRRGIKDLIARRMVEAFPRFERDGGRTTNEYRITRDGS